MTREELIELVAEELFKAEYGEEVKHLCFPKVYYEKLAKSGIKTIFDALQEPTNEMKDAFLHCYLELDNPQDTDLWKAMLNASPLAKEW